MAIKNLILTLTTRCNLNCAYCYVTDASPRGDMPLSVLKQAVFLAQRDGNVFHLQLTGGEPTLVPDLIRSAAEIALATNQCSGIDLQTNGTCLTPQIVDFIKQYGIQVGVSLDGPPAIHNAQRGLAGKTLQGLQLLESSGIPFRITAVITKASVSALSPLVLVLAGFSHARGIGLDLVVNKGRAKGFKGTAPAIPYTLKKELGHMLSTLHAVNASRTVPIRLRERELLFASMAHKDTGFCHAGSGQSMAVLPNGEVFPCGQTSGDPHFMAGTVWHQKNERLMAPDLISFPAQLCNGCDLDGHCPGECPGRLYYNRMTNPTLACDLYRTIREEESGPDQTA